MVSRTHVDDKSNFLNFRPTLHFLKTALKSVFPREVSFFYDTRAFKRSCTIPTWKRRGNDVETMSKQSLSKFGRTFSRDFVDFDRDFYLFRPPLRHQIDVDSTNYFSLVKVRPELK